MREVRAGNAAIPVPAGMDGWRLDDAPERGVAKAFPDRPKRLLSQIAARKLPPFQSTRDTLYRRDMYLLFLDESGQLSEQKFFALGGVALRGSDWRTLRGSWQETLSAHHRAAHLLLEVSAAHE